MATLRQLLENRLLPAIYTEQAPLELAAFLVRGDPIPYVDAVRGEFVPVKVGDAWGPPWSTTWLHVRGQVPAEWAGRKSCLFELALRATGFTVNIGRKGREAVRGVDPNPVLPIAGSEVDFYLAAAANPKASEAGRNRRNHDRARDRRSAFVPGGAPVQTGSMESALDFKVCSSSRSADRWGQPQGDLDDLAALPIRRRGPMADVSHACTPKQSSAPWACHIDTLGLCRFAKQGAMRPDFSTSRVMDEYPHFGSIDPAAHQWMKESYTSIRGNPTEVADGHREPLADVGGAVATCLWRGAGAAMLHGKRF